jgi:hypothetical protein
MRKRRHESANGSPHDTHLCLCQKAGMEELVRTNDMVMISVIESLFKEAEIIYMVADQNMSVLEGSIGLLPRRIMVVDGDRNRAISLLRNAGLGEELRMDVR